MASLQSADLGGWKLRQELVLQSWAERFHLHTMMGTQKPLGDLG